MSQVAAERAQAYIEAQDRFDNAWQATATHAGLREHVPMAVSAVKAAGWGAVTAWRSTALFRVINRENSRVDLPGDMERGIVRATAEAIITKSAK